VAVRLHAFASQEISKGIAPGQENCLKHGPI